MDSRHLVYWLAAAVTADRAATLPHYHLESNPVVLALGPWLWLAVSIAAVTGMVFVWRQWELWDLRIGRWTVSGLALFTGLIAINNIAIVL